MNKYYSFFDQGTGLISPQNLSCSSPLIAALNIPQGMAAIEGAYDHLSQCVDVSNLAVMAPIDAKSTVAFETMTPKVVDYIPPSPGDDYEWIHDDAEGNRVRRWLKKPEVVAIETAKAKAMARITELELDDQPRAMREAVIALLGRDNQAASRLVAIDDEIAMQRADLSPTIKSLQSLP